MKARSPTLAAISSIQSDLHRLGERLAKLGASEEEVSIKKRIALLRIETAMLSNEFSLLLKLRKVV